VTIIEDDYNIFINQMIGSETIDYLVNASESDREYCKVHLNNILGKRLGDLEIHLIFAESAHDFVACALEMDFQIILADETERGKRYYIIINYDKYLNTEKHRYFVLLEECGHIFQYENIFATEEHEPLFFQEIAEFVAEYEDIEVEYQEMVRRFTEGDEIHSHLALTDILLRHRDDDEGLDLSRIVGL
jgi:hypothetical protein